MAQSHESNSSSGLHAPSIKNGDHLRDANTTISPEPIHKFIGAWIPFESINRLEQPRVTFEEIPELAESIASHGLGNPITIAQLNEDACKRYLEVVNKVWGTEHTIDELFKTGTNGEKKYHILVAGERRFRAMDHLKKAGCEHCQEQRIAETCYENHFGRSEVEVRLMKNVSAREALNFQSAENIHKRVPPHEDAHFLYEYWRFVKEDDPEATLRGFARDVSRGEEQIRDAIKFCELPDNIQDYVKLGQIPYGIAIQISRLYKHPNPDVSIPEAELGYWAVKAITGQYRVPDFQELISKYIKDREGGQKSMFEIMTNSQREEFEKEQVKLVVSVGILRALNGNIGYLGTVLDLYEDGKLGLDDSPYSQGSPSRMILKMAHLVQRLVPHLVEHKALSRAKLEFVDVVAKDAMRMIAEMAGPIDIALSEGEQVSVNSNQARF